MIPVILAKSHVVSCFCGKDGIMLTKSNEREQEMHKKTCEDLKEVLGWVGEGGGEGRFAPSTRFCITGQTKQQIKNASNAPSPENKR